MRSIQMIESHIFGIEELKRINMVEFLSRYYGLNFSNGDLVGPGGSQYSCLSPFKAERTPSFFVREVDGHWLFKDFSSGLGGSLIDFVLVKEGFGEVREALNYIDHLLRVEPVGGVLVQSLQKSSGPGESKDKTYDVQVLYNAFRRNDVSQCRDYLLGRGINKETVEYLCGQELLVHNSYKGESYCCFAVFNDKGELRCLDNHQINGEGKFVLGEKHPFSLDWQELPSSERVFVTESIIDYLSIKTLEGFNFRGIALLGNVLNFSSDLFRSAQEVLSALDGDRGGFGAFLDLEERFSDRVIGVYDFGDSKDANEYLQKRDERQRSKRLSGEDKLLLYRDFQVSENKSEVALRWGINRSYMYEVVKECEELILSGFSSRRAGRKPVGQPRTLSEACQRLKELEAENRRLDEERERYWVRSEFMKLRLKWAEGEGEKQREEEEDLKSPVGNPSPRATENKKRHLKKKRKKR